ncbi:MAG: PAS domain-containing sensor histidine kinase [Cyanobacteria bacterium]|nr:PAS domain-containing sensor histidine kinase [Cyanobacteriota bacterium]
MRQSDVIIVVLAAVGNCLWIVLVMFLQSILPIDSKLLILLAGLGCMGITYGGWLKFKSVTGERLIMLADNISRLRSGKPLNSTISNRGMLARIDKAVFNTQDLLSQQRQALELSESRTRILIEALLVGLIIIDSNGHVLSVNPRTVELFEQAPKEMVGKNISTILPDLGLSFPLNKERLKDLYECSGSSVSGRTIFFEVSVKEFGESIQKSWIVSLLDVSERRVLEQLKQEFLQMVTHDLRSPLTSILLFVELLQDGIYGQLTEQGSKKTKSVRDGAERLLNLVNGLLDIEKLSMGAVALELEDTEVASIFETTTEALDALIQKKRINLEVDGADLELVCDEERIAQVLINLVSNAIKYSPDGGTVRMEATYASKVYEFSVADDGPGIPFEHQDALFQRFFQVPNAKKVGGTGLGLAICKEITRAHGGDIGVESKPGEGARFWIRIPLLDKPIARSDS